MRSKLPTKIIDSPGWYILMGLGLGWIGAAGASDSWRNRLLVAGLILVLLMAAIDLVYRIQSTKQSDSVGQIPSDE